VKYYFCFVQDLQQASLKFVLQLFHVLTLAVCILLFLFYQSRTQSYTHAKMTRDRKSACCLSKRRSMIRVGREPHAVFSNRSRAPSLPLLIKTPMEVPNCQPRKGPLPDDDDMDNDDDDLSVYRKSSRRRNTAFHSTIDDSMGSACKHVAHKTTTTAFNQQTSLVHDQTSLQPRHDQTKPYSSVLI
jgi:hypothetical protein